MAISSYLNVGISSIVSVVPSKVIDNYEMSFFGEEEAKRIHEKSGIRYRRHVEDHTCSSDLGVFAGEKLITGLSLDRDSIDCLLFVTQTADYKMPFTAAIVHDRLGLREDSGALDINLGCSGFVYALDMAYALVASGGKERILVINSETRSKVYSSEDKGTGLLFGDAASAVLVERQDGASAFFSSHTDGSGFENIIIPAGGYKFPSTHETIKIQEHDNGSFRSLEQGTMVGINVFNFAITKVPKSINSLLSNIGISPDSIDYCVLHQANMMMNNMIAKKIKIPSDKLLSSIENYGNTSSVSIPLTITKSLCIEKSKDENTILLSGFGVGLSWCNAVLKNKGFINLGVYEYN